MQVDPIHQFQIHDMVRSAGVVASRGLDGDKD
jgi:hypothetical protein